MALELGQIIEGIGPIEFAGVNQAHENVADVGAVVGLVKQGIPPVSDGLFQRPLADVIVQRRSGYAQEERQLLPVPEQVRNRAAQRRIGLHAPLVELLQKPDVEFLHRWTAFGLVKEQSFLGRQAPFSGDRIVTVDHGERFQHVPAFFGKPVCYLDELPPTVGQAVGQDRLQFRRRVSRQGVTHLDRRGQLCRAAGSIRL